MTMARMEIEALRLMFANDEEPLSEAAIDRIETDIRYRDLCQMMPGALYRCLLDMERRGLPYFGGAGVPVVDDDTPRTTDLTVYTGVPERMQAVIPYFIKSECFRGDMTQIGEAQAAYDLYEAALEEELKGAAWPRQETVRDVTGFERWNEF